MGFSVLVRIAVGNTFLVPQHPHHLGGDDPLDEAAVVRPAV
jgi:hypothetical protein